MAEWDINTAYEMLMSPTPYTQASGAAMIRNFATAAQLMAQHLRTTGSGGADAGDAGLAMQRQSEAHAQWFDQVAANSTDAADHLERLARAGNSNQATAAEVKAGYDQAVANDTGQNPSGADDVHLIHMSTQGSQTLSRTVTDWGNQYSGFKAPKAPAVPSGSGGTYGSGGTGGGAGAGYGTPSGGGGSTSASSGAQPEAAFAVPASVRYAAPEESKLDRGPGVPGSVEVGPDGGEFAGWYHDPRTGYYVDPKTGREYDPVTQRWIDPVTGQPFGDVTKYATSLQGLGPESTSGGLLSDGGAALSAGASSGGGGASGLPGLFAAGPAGNPAAIAGAYGGTLPPSLVNGSAAAGSLWNQAGQSLAVKQAMAGELVGREQAARAGRPYLPPTQAQGGVGAGGARNRPGYLTADDEEAALFSTPGRRTGPSTASEEGELAAAGTADETEQGLLAGSVGARYGAPSGLDGARPAGEFGGPGARFARPGSAAAEGEAEQAAMAGRRPYLPPTQAGMGGGKDENRRERPAWLVDDNVFTTDDAPPGVLGE